MDSATNRNVRSIGPEPPSQVLGGGWQDVTTLGNLTVSTTSLLAGALSEGIRSGFRDVCLDLRNECDDLALFFMQWTEVSGEKVELETYRQAVPSRNADANIWEECWQEILALFAKGLLPIGAVLLDLAPFRTRAVYLFPFQDTDSIRKLVDEAIEKTFCDLYQLPWRGTLR